DKHVPWIHNVKNTNVVAAINDEDTLRVLRLFNEESGKKALHDLGVKADSVDKLSYLGISSICNMLASIKLAKYYEYNENDIIFTIFTDSVELYYSRLKEMNENWGKYNDTQALIDYNSVIKKQGIDYLKELTYEDQRRIHNLKYFTWVEQQGKEVEELDAQWYDENYWEERFSIAPKWDKLIEDFNKKVNA
ncbi:MAG: hypothetical protein P8Y81_07810, partial [Ignavibacteriaceae bacterium]